MTTAETATRPPLDGVLEAAIYVDDLDAAVAFYGGVLGLETVLRHDPRHVFFRCGSTIVLAFDAALSREPSQNPDLPVPPHGATGAGHICFATDSAALEHWVQHFKAQGIAPEADFHWLNGARSVYLRDPAGNSVELAERRLWEGAA